MWQNTKFFKIINKIAFCFHLIGVIRSSLHVKIPHSASLHSERRGRWVNLVGRQVTLFFQLIRLPAFIILKSRHRAIAQTLKMLNERTMRVNANFCKFFRIYKKIVYL